MDRGKQAGWTEQGLIALPEAVQTTVYLDRGVEACKDHTSKYRGREVLGRVQPRVQLRWVAVLPEKGEVH